MFSSVDVPTTRQGLFRDRFSISMFILLSIGSQGLACLNLIPDYMVAYGLAIYSMLGISEDLNVPDERPSTILRDTAFPLNRACMPSIAFALS